ncbi:MAG: penicillin acylase family protein [Fidelibacterota bacterium]
MMKKILLSVLVILGLAVLVFKLYFAYDLPRYEGRLTLSGLNEPVDVLTDEFGVPHIFANNENDLFFTAGYIAARERLWQMTVVRSAARGELANLFGRDLLSSDIYLRTWRIPEIGRRGAEQMNPDILTLVQRFCDGINAWVEESADNLPPEFKILGAKPLRWEPSDVISYARLMAHDLQQSWKPEALFGAVLEYYGQEKLTELLPPYGSEKPTISQAQMPPGLMNLYSFLEQEESKIRHFTGTDGPNIGSNCFVVAGSKTTTGKPILANDPHLGFTQPAKWYEMHMSGGRFNVSGVCLAGLPVPVLGQNDAIAWGFTNVMADDIDFFVETVDPDDPTRYQSGDEWLTFATVTETIPIKGGTDTTITIRSTKHGPVISDLHYLMDKDGPVISFQWTGHDNFKILESLFELSLAKDWDSYSAAVEKFGVPGQNIVYADTAGNIGWRPAVKIPIRKDGASLVPRPGNDPSYDWQGYVPFDEMPFLFNPDAGYIVTANNKSVGDDYPYYISNLWAHPSRAMRILERLQDEAIISVDEIKDIQTDLISPMGRQLGPRLAALTSPDIRQGNVAVAMDLLADWDGDESPDSPAALVFHSVLWHLIQNVYRDELDLIGPDAFAAYVDLAMIPHRNIEWVLMAGTSSWIDNVATPDYEESLTDIVNQSFRDAVAEIEDMVGPDPALWAWGAVHTLTHPHDLAQVAILDIIFHFNVGPFRTGGSGETVNNGGFSYDNPYVQDFGPSMRRIANLSDLDRTQFILPTGQSGLPRSPHYRDQAEMFIRGEYRTTRVNRDSMEASDAFRKLELVPE